MNKGQINEFLRKNWTRDMEFLCQQTGLTEDAVFGRGRRMKLKSRSQVSNEKPVTKKEQVKKDIEQKKEKASLASVKSKYDHVLEENETLAKKLEIALELKKGVSSYNISKPKNGQGSEATIIALASDWHIEEEVKPQNVNGMNFYNLEESKRRSDKYFQVLLRLVEIEQKDSTVNNVIIGLLGDFISSDINEDVSKSCLLQPTHALLRCQEYIISGIEYMLKNSELNLTLVCHSGNHGRKDKEQMIANESGNSLEYMMYHILKVYFKNESRVKFIIEEGYHSYVQVYDTTVRFHHGHAIRFGGGVGGFTIPVNKAIAQWNRAKKADIDCFGHFHQVFDGGNFIANGSMIGWSPYAINIKASYERPAQMMFGIHSRVGKYVTRPILFN